MNKKSCFLKMLPALTLAFQISSAQASDISVNVAADSAFKVNVPSGTTRLHVDNSSLQLTLDNLTLLDPNSGNIGMMVKKDGTAAFGVGSSATGQYSFAAGRGTNASERYATAFGHDTTASGE